MKRALAVLLPGALLLAVYARFGVGIPCVFYQTTGLYCPGCGGMRAVWSLLHLELYQALRYNALLVVTLPPMAVYLTADFCLRRTGRQGLQFSVGANRFWRVVLVVVVLFAVARNIPLFGILAPVTL